jgi:hypothetical protein
LKVLFDQGVPVPLRAHVIETAHKRGWGLLKNGELIAAAEFQGFEVFVTTDQNLKHQQNLKVRRVAIAVLLSTSGPRIQKNISHAAAAIEGLRAGDYTEVPVS